MPFPRAAGVLLHPTCLPGGHGIGDLGEPAYRFVDALARAGQSVWQVLPLGPTGAANSPYQALSSFAGNPLLISLERLAEAKLLTPPDLQPPAPPPEGHVDFQAVATFKVKALREAFRRFEAGKADPSLRKEADAFRKAEAAWVEDFALYMALKESHDGKAWYDWPDAALRAHDANAVRAAREEMTETIAFHVFLQFLFFRQWTALRRYAADKAVRFMGDLPIYVAHDSADVWASPRFFQLDAKGKPTGMAGVPPDYFCPEGQLWGNPLYDWEALRADGYRWWLDRIRASLRTVDMLRIDHFRGFEAYWAVPAGEETAVDGKWIKGPGNTFFETLRRELGSDLPIVAEDLGTITADVHALREDFGIPGMKVLQFGFHEGADLYLPHTFEKNCVAYTATHDNDTTRGWYEARGGEYEHMDRHGLDEERDRVRRYLGRDGSDIAWDMIRLLLQSVADTAVVPVQDLLDLGSEARMNRPGCREGQWTWRMTPAHLDAFPADRLMDLTWLYGRTPRQAIERAKQGRR